jgi:hypothetical protein
MQRRLASSAWVRATDIAPERWWASQWSGFVAPSVAAELDAGYLVLLNAMEPEALVSISHRPRRNQVMGYGERDPGYQDDNGQNDDAADDHCGVSVVG